MANCSLLPHRGSKMTSEASNSDSQQGQAASSIEQLLSEGLIGTSAAACLLGSFKNERPVHPSTLARWALRGVRTADGRVVRLETARIPPPELSRCGSCIRTPPGGTHETAQESRLRRE